MTTDEFSQEFDTIINSYAASPAFEDLKQFTKAPLVFDEYEKSVFLTKAQEETIIGLYNGSNPDLNYFEKTEEVRRYLSGLVKTVILTEKKDGLTGLEKGSIFFELPKDLLFITYETVEFDDTELGCMDGSSALVIATTQESFYRTRKNPFRGSGKRRVLRLDIEDNKVELVSDYNIKSYLIRYLSKPKPIILTDLPDDLMIDEEGHKTECELNTLLHRPILMRAIQMALASRGVSTK